MDAEVVYVVDDDASTREALLALIRQRGYRAQGFATADEFMRHERPQEGACLVLDVSMPGTSGLEMQRDLVRLGDTIPIIFVTGHADVRMSVRAMKDGAFEFMPKPIEHADLLEAIRAALERDRVLSASRREAARLRALYDTLTPREREVMEQIVRGALNKQIGADLGIAEITVKVHRRSVMSKMGAGSLAELVRMAQQLQERPGAYTNDQ